MRRRKAITLAHLLGNPRRTRKIPLVCCEFSLEWFGMLRLACAVADDFASVLRTPRDRKPTHFFQPSGTGSHATSEVVVEAVCMSWHTHLPCILLRSLFFPQSDRPAVAQGKGTALGEIPNIEKRLSATKKKDKALKLLHRVIFPGHSVKVGQWTL